MKRWGKVVLFCAGCSIAVLSAAGFAVPRYMQHRRYVEAASRADLAFQLAWKCRNLPDAYFAPVDARYQDALSSFRELDAVTKGDTDLYEQAASCDYLLDEYRDRIRHGLNPVAAENQALHEVRNDQYPNRCRLIE